MLETLLHHIAVCVIVHNILWRLIKPYVLVGWRAASTSVIAAWNHLTDAILQVVLLLLAVVALWFLGRIVLPALFPTLARRSARQVI